MKKIILLCFCFTIGSMVNAQSLERMVIGSAGLAVQNTNAGLSYTVGETATQSANLLTQGFQQPKIKTNTGTIELDNLKTKAMVFPNPTVDILNIKSNLPLEGIQTLDYQVFDMYGKVVLSGNIAANGGVLDVSFLASASYVLTLTSGTQYTKTVRFTRI